ncbi:MAG: insulinase family protein [Deltaproteobacteria bacterium]|nr:insulinase family protein [Deltaproteobacteria bacterium]MBW2307011.1 insulinase family protein [Deltaproteobacteria bacterium]
MILFPFSSIAGIGLQVREKTLDNGLKVILLENHKASVITFQVWYRVGSRNEEPGKTGLSHLLEHMMFKGTQKVGPEEISRIIQEAGGRINAFTSKDYTAYFETLSADRISIAMELESDRMANLALREEDFRTEKMVVMEERRLRTEDQPLAILMEEANALAYRSHPYQWPVVGWMSDIARLTLDDIRHYYETYYIPNNAFLVVAGDFQTDRLLAQIEKYFGSIPRGPTPPSVRGLMPPQIGERRVTLRRQSRLHACTFLYHVPNLSHPDSFALEVLNAVLSTGKSSRLYRALVSDTPLALEANADYNRISHDPGLFSVFAQLLPGKTFEQVQNSVEQELDAFKREPIKGPELQKAKNQLEASFIFGLDSLFYQAMLLARYEISGGWRKLKQYLTGIRNVSAQDIQKVARKYFRSENRTIGILVPEKTKKSAPLEKSQLHSKTTQCR